VGTTGDAGQLTLLGQGRSVLASALRTNYSSGTWALEAGQVVRWLARSGVVNTLALETG
jgi:hypothetical protein